MKKFNIFLLATLVFSGSIVAQKVKTDDPKMDWWKEAKFGMFIHWGLYSIPAGEWNGKRTHNIAEWILMDLQIPVAEYKAYAKQFNPVKFNAEEIVLLAKEAGMKYIVFTAKHHEGFAMYKSADPFNIVDATPYGKDVVQQLADACIKHNMPLGLYYSQAQDWTHPGGSNYYNKIWDKLQEGDFAKYIDEVSLPQVKEIMEKFNPRIVWWDTPAKMTPELAKKFTDYLAKYPNLITNDRLGGGVHGDLETPEQYIPATGIPGKNWESCMTMNGTWGFSKFDQNWKSTEMLVRNMIDIASKGGNYLLNIGPTAEGEVPVPSVERLKEVGVWMRDNAEAIYGTKASPFSQLSWGRCTQKTKGKNTTLYMSVFNWPSNGKLVVDGLVNKVLKAYPLANKKQNLKIEVKEAENIINLSNVKQSQYATVIVLEINGKPVVNDAPAIVAENEIFTTEIEFSATTNSKDVQIRYTTDGSMPTAVSPIVSSNVKLSDSKDITVKVAGFNKNNRVSAVTTKVFRKEIPVAPFYSGTPGLRYKYYEGSWMQLPDFNALTTLKTGVVNDFNLKERKSDLYYGFTFDGYISVPETDIYTFYLRSDDGSKLIIDDTKILDNDGTHGMDEKRIDVALEKGLHKISMQFFQHGGGQGLKLEWKQKGKVRKAVDKSVLSY